jgi:hypothetical protein
MTRIMAISTLLLVLFGAAGCHPGEGERCNPLQFSNDCDTGFACVYQDNCSVAYCCPTTRASTNPNCQVCPAPDAGSGSGDVSDAATSD